MSQFFLLRSKQDVLRCCAYISSLSFMGKRWSLRVEEYKPKRSLSQNRLWHAWCGILAKEKGYEAAEMKILLKAHFQFYEYVTNKKTGEVIPSLRSTADLNVTEFMSLITQTEVLAAKEGILLPRDEDYYVSMGVEQNARQVTGIDGGGSEHIPTTIFQQGERA